MKKRTVYLLLVFLPSLCLSHSISHSFLLLLPFFMPAYLFALSACLTRSLLFSLLVSLIFLIRTVIIQYFVTEKYQSVAYANTFIISYLGSALFTISTISFLAFNKQSRRLWGFWWQRLVDCCCLPEEMPSADV